MRNRMAAVFFLALAGCVSPEPVDVEAQRAEYAAITLDWVARVQADATLTEEQKANRLLTAETQDLRIRKLEAGVTR